MEERIGTHKQKGSDVSLRDFLLKIKAWYYYLISKWLVIIVFGVLGAVLGFAYAYTKKSIYVAATTFVLEEDKSGGGGLSSLAGLASMAGVDVDGGGGIFQGDNIVELYKSRNMIEKTLLTKIDHNGVKKLLIDRFIEFNKLRQNWSEKPELKKMQFHATEKFTRLQDSVLGDIVNDIRKNYLNVTKPDKKLSIIKTEIKSYDEFFAKAFNEQIVKNVNDFYVQTKTKKSLANVAILQQKTDSVRAEMNGAIYSGAAVADATPNLNPTRQIQRIAPMQRSQFSAETNRAILGELVKNLELSKISLRKETPLIQVIDQPVLPLEVIRIGKAKGIILGGFISGFLCVIGLLVSKILKEIMA